jgi:hypothetical protein
MQLGCLPGCPLVSTGIASRQRAINASVRNDEDKGTSLRGRFPAMTPLMSAVDQSFAIPLPNTIPLIFVDYF